MAHAVQAEPKEKTLGHNTSGKERTPSRTGNIIRILQSDYYVWTILLSAITYFPLRAAYQDAPVYEGSVFQLQIRDFHSWERYLAFLCFSSGFIKGWRARSVDGALWTLLAFTQLFVACMAMICNTVVMAHLLLGYLLVFMLFPQPSYPIHDALEVLTPEAFLDTIKKPDCDATWVVYFYADWHSSCRQMASVAAELAGRYSSDKLQFGYMDLGEFSRFASKLDIDLSPMSDQLPTIALYEKGEELMRLPRKQGGKVYGNEFRAKDVIRVMELDMRYARSMVKASEKKDK